MTPFLVPTTSQWDSRSHQIQQVFRYFPTTPTAHLPSPSLRFSWTLGSQSRPIKSTCKVVTINRWMEIDHLQNLLPGEKHVLKTCVILLYCFQNLSPFCPWRLFLFKIELDCQKLMEDQGAQYLNKRQLGNFNKQAWNGELLCKHASSLWSSIPLPLQKNSNTSILSVSIGRCFLGHRLGWHRAGTFEWLNNSGVSICPYSSLQLNRLRPNVDIAKVIQCPKVHNTNHPCPVQTSTSNLNLPGRWIVLASFIPSIIHA